MKHKIAFVLTCIAIAQCKNVYTMYSAEQLIDLLGKTTEIEDPKSARKNQHKNFEINMFIELNKRIIQQCLGNIALQQLELAENQEDIRAIWHTIQMPISPCYSPKKARFHEQRIRLQEILRNQNIQDLKEALSLWEGMQKNNPDHPIINSMQQKIAAFEKIASQQNEILMQEEQ